MKRSYSAPILAVTWLLRIVVGALFVFSGFTKGVDVWGTYYKFNEYFAVWGYEVSGALNILGVFTLCVAEFITGCFLLLGCFRRGTPIIALAIMLFMLPLSLWLAVKEPIADCGCFGDALVLTNWQTFYKNIFLFLATIWLVPFNRRTPWFIMPYLQWIAAVVVAAYVIAVAWVGYYYQPLIDFRPYKVGTVLTEHDSSSSDYDADSLLRFVYEKNGQKEEFGIDDVLPDEEDGWTFVERYYAEPEVGAIPAENQPSAPEKSDKNLRFFSEDGNDDLTEEVAGNGRQLILMIPDLSEVSPAKTWMINSLYRWCEDNDVDMFAAVGGNPLEIRKWKDISLAEYPIYTSDDTSIKEVVRGNPGIVYVEDGIIKWKSSLRALNIDDFQDSEVGKDPMNFARNDRAILLTLTWIFTGCIAMLMLLSFLFTFNFRKVAGEYNDSGNENEEDKTESAEEKESSEPETEPEQTPNE